MTADEHRKKENEEVLRKLKTGESLAMVDVRASWFPPRPIIKKSATEMGRLFGIQVVHGGSGE